jgi:hypothetical protein
MSGAYDSATALLVVDVQNDFADPAGGLYVRGGEEIIDAVNVEIAAAIEAWRASLASTTRRPRSVQEWHYRSALAVPAQPLYLVLVVGWCASCDDAGACAPAS